MPFQLRTSLPLKTEAWVRIAQGASWHMTRMNLNTFARHGVFKEPGMEKMIARRLADPAEVRRARVFPYQPCRPSSSSSLPSANAGYLPSNSNSAN